MRWSVCHFNHLPKWLQDNEYLITGHRPPLRSFRACFDSIFLLHTETINIWTHLIGCFVFFILGVYSLYQFAQHSWLDMLVLGAFFFCAVLCLGFSSAYHLFSCHSPQVGRLFSKLDYCGIALLITGSFIPWLYYGFYCDTKLKLLYISIAVLLCACTIVVSLSEKFSEPHFRPFRAGVFGLFGMSGIFPGLHWLASNWLSTAALRTSLFCLGLMAVLYILGALLYAARIPERFFPGKCDIWFHSHQIFHILVLAAAMVHYRGISHLAIHRLSEQPSLRQCGPIYG